jgi:DNA modification methylase
MARSIQQRARKVVADAIDGAAAEWVSPADLKPWARNPRKHDDAAIAKVAESIRTFGFGAPIVARRATREIVAGHTRWKAAQQLRLERVPVRYIDLDEHKAHLLALADNRLGEFAEWDAPELHALLQEYAAPDLALAGWSDKDLEQLTRSLGDEPVEQDEIPPLPKTPVTKLGDVWVLGEHRLRCGDCTDGEALRYELFEDQNAAYTFTSPPYGIDLDYEKGEPLDALVDLIARAIAGIDAISAPGAYATMNYADVFRPGDPGFTLMSGYYDKPFRARGWWLRGNRIWLKPFARLQLAYGISTTMNLREWEYVRTWRKGKKQQEKLRDHSITLRGVWKSFGDDAIVEHNSETDDTTSKATHQAAFPVLLPTAGMRAYTDEHDLVWEPFCGSGTTIIAAERESRRCYASELSPAYCDVAIERWQALTGKKATRK